MSYFRVHISDIYDLPPHISDIYEIPHDSPMWYLSSLDFSLYA